MEVQNEEKLLLEFSVETCACGKKPALKVDDTYMCRVCFDRRAPKISEPKKEEKRMRKIIGEELASPALIEIIEHYVDSLTLEINEIIFIDDYTDERINAYSDEEKAFCFNFARMPTKATEHGWGHLILISALWAVQVSCVLETIRIAVQEQYYGFEKLDEEQLDGDIEMFVSQELQEMATKDERLFMPKRMGDMGIIGIRVRDALNEQFTQGLAKEDFAAWTCGGDVNTDEFRKFLRSEAVDALQAQIKRGNMGRFHEGFHFITIGEFMVLTCDDSFLTEDAAAIYERKTDSLTAVCEAIEEGSIGPEDVKANLGSIADAFKNITEK